MAHKKGVGSTDNGRDSNSKRLGVKLFGGQHANLGSIIVRQRGTKYHPGEFVGVGKDFTLYALKEGSVNFTKGRSNRTVVNIIPNEAQYDIESFVALRDKIRKGNSSAVKKVESKKSSPEVKQEANMGSEEVKNQIFSTIGTASEDSKDDLKKIKGVGPKLEETLNSLGIFTFEQVSKMTDKEYDLVDSLLSSFKGRGKTDQWHIQAKELMG